MSISQLVNEISEGSVVLPAIQRDFVWGEDRITKLFDSLFRGYPVGIVLLWETFTPLQYREFSSDYRPDQLSHFKDNAAGKRIRVVLDGQQRLSSLYVALKGTYNGKRLYFDVLSGRESDDYSEDKFGFLFATAQEAAERNAVPDSFNATHCCWISLDQIVGRSPFEIVSLKSNLASGLNLDVDDRTRVEVNFHLANYVLSDNSELLKTQIIDSNLTANDQRRKTVFDILEIFVRINRQGLALQRSDLIISLLRLYWPEASILLPQFIKDVNVGNSFKLDNDFVIRCMFATAGLGTRLDFDLLRRRANVERIKAVYSDCCTAIRSAIDFVKTQCYIDSSRLLGGPSTLIPLVYFIFSSDGGLVKTDAIWSARKSIYLFAFSKIFTQHVDSRTGSFIRDYLAKSDTQQSGKFPFQDAIRYTYQKMGFDEPNVFLFGNNRELALSLVQRLSGGKVLFPGNAPEIDHIFPRSTLEHKGVDYQEINSLGNLWILPQTLNRNKSAVEPAKFLKAVEDEFLHTALIDRESLDGRTFKRFIKTREDAITQKLIKITGLTSDQFECLASEDNSDEE